MVLSSRPVVNQHRRRTYSVLRLLMLELKYRLKRPLGGSMMVGHGLEASRSGARSEGENFMSRIEDSVDVNMSKGRQVDDLNDSRRLVRRRILSDCKMIKSDAVLEYGGLHLAEQVPVR